MTHLVHDRPLILIADDDKWMRQMTKRMITRQGYAVIEASDGTECLRQFEEHLPDLILMDAVMPIMDGFTACERLKRSREGERTPVLIITGLNDAEAVDRAFAAGATDYLTKPIHWPVLHHRLKRIIKAKKTDDILQQKIAQLDILHRIDRELGYTLDVTRVVNLAMDTAIRWTGASGCVVAWVEDETQLLQPLASLGQPEILTEAIPLSQLHTRAPLLARLLDEEMPYVQEAQDDQRAMVVLPLVSGRKRTGLIGLEGIHVALLDDDGEGVDFLLHLASRTAAGIDKTQAHRKTRIRAEQIDRLYTASTAISSHLEQADVTEVLTQGFVTLLDASGGFYCEYQPRTEKLVVRQRYVIDAAEDVLPEIGAECEINVHPGLMGRIGGSPEQFTRQNPDSLPIDWRRFILDDCQSQTSLVVPLQIEDRFIGVVVVCESRFERHFLPDEIGLARSLAAQGAVALHQATLFDNIRGLEQLKSEMIRMASHDLRNPLAHISGFFEILTMELDTTFNDEQQEFVAYIRKAIKTMEDLLADILNLERAESQSKASWKPVDLLQLVQEVADALRGQSILKKQTYTVKTDGAAARCFALGDTTQLRQACSNLISNAIKYTPEGGTIEVRIYTRDLQFYFEVEDNGYGIPEEQQSRLFERFFRAHIPGAESIEGTGLGLSLVKSVIEHHQGETWFKSRVGHGSTFGFWVPLDTAVEPEL
ncbi:MAG: response regulator [Chloroflexi bacterium]|nr:response regulator [Chloroflexota bacterium]